MHESRIDSLIGRAADGAESASEWSEFCVLAERQPSAWRDLAIQQREARLLSASVDRAVGAADVVELPHVSHPFQGEGVLARVGAETGRERPLHQMRPEPSHPTRWMGWVVAACVVAAWGFSALPRQRGAETAAMNTAGLVPMQTADDALQAYLDRGRADGVVVGEVPSKMLLESRPLDGGGGFEVVFVRQIVERRNVPALIEFSQADEFGRPVAVQLEARRGSSL
ncbi:MAG: hypothetical protein KDA22_09450 [Phycisphaerales bacterium]|nr:hypothetical protein [Phycisphaerales bacterium]